MGQTPASSGPKTLTATAKAAPGKSNAVQAARDKMKAAASGLPAYKSAAALKTGQVNIGKSGAVQKAKEKMAAAAAPMKGSVTKMANGKSGERAKVLPNRLTGKVKEWKGKFGWIVAEQKISHPEAKKNEGKIYLAHEDVEEELSGVGASVSFFVYSDGKGLGARNVKPFAAANKFAAANTANKLAAASKLTAMTKPGGFASKLK